MTQHFLSPRIDVIFKILFGDGRDIDILTDFLKAVLKLPAEDYAEVSVVDPYLSRDLPEDKLGILDVKVKTKTGKIVDVEIQVDPHPQMRERVIFYQAKMITEQIGNGEGYAKIQRVISIIITDHVLIPENDTYHNRYTLRDPQTGSEFTQLLEVNTLELPKLPQAGDGAELWDWMKFLNARNTEDLTMLTTKNPMIHKAVAKLQVLSEDEQTRLLAESREKLQRDNAARMQDAERKGLERGREEGREEGRTEERRAFARKLLEDNHPIEEIMKYTGLSREEIRALLH
jgi:predicted transposase/invertase (TIGR01784 family)